MGFQKPIVNALAFGFITSFHDPLHNLFLRPARVVPPIYSPWGWGSASMLQRELKKWMTNHLGVGWRRSRIGSQQVREGKVSMCGMNPQNTNCSEMFRSLPCALLRFLAPLALCDKGLFIPPPWLTEE